MTTHSFPIVRILALGTILGWGLCPNKADADPAIGADAAAGAQVLTRGPIHEAFAEPVVFNPAAGVTVAKTPPAAIEEIPPDQRPEGANVAWIPGYWGWDDERNDFLWVSGIWRALPPGRQWIPGYWAASGQGSQWTSGYWADAAASEVEYLPEPPATVEAGPNVAALSPNDSWIPGSWVWQQNRYAWRPGVWASVQPDWVWIPTHYVWAPRGYVFVAGYWDYPVGRRGVLFAPVFFNGAAYSRLGFFYSPTIVIDSGVFADQLFVRPSYCSYYFGDYYAAGYAASGFYSSFSYQASRYGYDPIFARQTWEHRNDPGWQRGIQATFLNRRDHQDARPPRTFAAQQRMAAGPGNSGNRSFVATTSLDQLARRQDSPLRFQPVDKQERQQFLQRGQNIQKFGEDRQRLESPSTGSPTGTISKGYEPTRLKLPSSPLASNPAGPLSRDNAPPLTRELPKQNFSTQARPEVRTQTTLNQESLPKFSVGGQSRPNLPPQTKQGFEPRSSLQPDGQPKLNTQPQPRQTRPTPESQPPSRAETQPRPIQTSQPQPRVESNPRIETQPRPTPQPQPRTEAQPHPAPANSAPQSKPTGDPNEKPKK